MQPHKIFSENTDIRDFNPQKWNYSTIQQENRSLKEKPVRTQLMKNWQKTNYSWSEMVQVCQTEPSIIFFLHV